MVQNLASHPILNLKTYLNNACMCFGFVFLRETHKRNRPKDNYTRSIMNSTQTHRKKRQISMMLVQIMINKFFLIIMPMQSCIYLHLDFLPLCTYTVLELTPKQRNTL